MTYADSLTRADEQLAASLTDFLPPEIYDIHTHPYHAAHFPPGSWSFLRDKEVLGCAEHRGALQRYMPVPNIHGLYFGMPLKTADRPAMNEWVASEVRTHGTSRSRALMVVSPEDNPDEVAAALRSGEFCGLKVYHFYANRPDTMNAEVEEFAPDWMWELLHEVRGVLMLHIVRDGAMEDAQNQAVAAAALPRLSRAQN